MRPAPLAVLLLLLARPAPGLAQVALCLPIAEQRGRTAGCFITAREELGPLPRDSALYWYIDAFQARSTAEAARGARSTVVEAFGAVWLFTIAPPGWRTLAGRRVTAIGPLALFGADSFAAVYVEERYRPGMRSPVHRHPGVEVRYALEGEQCVELPAGKALQRVGDPPVIIPPGQPMQVRGVGSTPIRALVLILEDASKRHAVLAPDWDPPGLCTS